MTKQSKAKGHMGGQTWVQDIFRDRHTVQVRRSKSLQLELKYVLLLLVKYDEETAVWLDGWKNT